jgi:predicted flap endonuclease-1-like 5' DNA nuclease
MATTKTQRITLEGQLDKVKSKVKNFHDEALQVSDKFVDTSLTTGSKWQKLMAKGLNQGTVILAKQQDLVLDALEELKSQYVYSSKRVVKLFGLEPSKPIEVKAKLSDKKPKTTRTKKAVSTSKTIKVSSKNESVKDNLTVIDGIGKKFELLLNDFGITTMKQLASASMEDLQTVLTKAGPMFKSYDPSIWVEQAKQLTSK